MAAAEKRTCERHQSSLSVTSQVGDLKVAREAPVDQYNLSAGLKLVVQRTFFEVIEEEDDIGEAEPARRARSAPVRKTAPQEEVERPECAFGVASEQEVLDVQGNEVRKTTVVIRNIPSDYTRDQLVELLDVDFGGCYNFLYMPIDFAQRVNFGYGFINLTSTEHANRFFTIFDGFSSWGLPHDMQATVSWSWNQGLEEHIERYRNSPVMHESMQDECKPIVLESGVRVDFPPPTKRVPHLRRLRTRCGSGGRGVSSTKLGEIYGSRLDAAPPAPAGPCALLPGLSSASGGAAEGASCVMASPLFAGLKRVDDAPVPPAPGAHRKKKAQKAWADLQDDLGSECSTGAPSSLDGTLSSGASDGHSEPVHDHSSARPWSRSMLADGLVAVPEEEEQEGENDDVKGTLAWAQPGSLIEVVGTYPSGGQAVITEINGQDGTFRIQLMRDGQLTRRRRTIKCKHARLLQFAGALASD